MPPRFAAAPKCTYCGKSVYFAEQAIGPASKVNCVVDHPSDRVASNRQLARVNLSRSIYHKPCLKCSSCSKTLEPGALLDHDSDPYCKACHGKAFGTRGYGVGGALVADYHDPRSSSKAIPNRFQEVTSPSGSTSTQHSSLSAPQATEMPSTGPSRRTIDATLYGPRASLPNMPPSTVPPKPSLAGRASVSTPLGRISGDQCPRCRTTVYAAEQALAVGSKWHKRCLRCAGCSTSLALGQLNEKDGEPWCRNCYAKKFGHLAQGVSEHSPDSDLMSLECKTKLDPTTTTTATTNAGASKRRRCRAAHPLGEGESSREASAESNDETGQSGLDEDDNASLSAFGAAKASSSLPASGRTPLSTRESSEAPGIPGARVTRRTNGTNTASPQLANTSKIMAEDAIDSEGSAGHDGDISSATAANPVRSSGQHFFRAPIVSQLQQHASHASTSTDSAPPSPPNGSPRPVQPSRHPGHSGSNEPPTWAAAPQGFLSSMSAQDIQQHIQAAIDGQDGRAYSINPPPQDRPVRIYADGVYDLLHYGHMLQLRQCKLAFPSVHLIVGVCSDEIVRKYKASPVLSSQERYESVRHCKWVDEVVEDAPWVIDEAFMKKHEIDYVAHDEEPYVSADFDDVYALAKSKGQFLPTRRTNGVSTSELLQRIVEGYREGSVVTVPPSFIDTPFSRSHPSCSDYDGKLRKIGHPELCSRQGSEAGTGGSQIAENHPLKEDVTMLSVPENAALAV
ncbi:BQ2448_7054 [Microbotryum intermedium]|uniref:choline-phosphate cytidylyltransferase n=1 Tax=Microbotryum intermedium TaxID=269621 RepID=A0A238FK06_9BASI|nr:BQ2448_7054 [Microbotryum intermedium]